MGPGYPFFPGPFLFLLLQIIFVCERVLASVFGRIEHSSDGHFGFFHAGSLQA
jgi:hypothetical protein